MLENVEFFVYNLNDCFLKKYLCVNE